MMKRIRCGALSNVAVGVAGALRGSATQAAALGRASRFLGRGPIAHSIVSSDNIRKSLRDTERRAGLDSSALTSRNLSARGNIISPSPTAELQTVHDIASLSDRFW
jgi:hypothetical protein